MVVADHPLVAEPIRVALRRTAGFEIVGFVDGRRTMGPQLAAARPDVVIVDDMQQQAWTLARIGELPAWAPAAKCLLLTDRMDSERLHAAFRAGAHAAIRRSIDSVTLGTLLRETARDNVVHRFSAHQQEPVRDRCTLTHRELEILGYVAEGRTNSSIAQALWVTEQTVKFHLSNLYRKLGVANRTEASRYAYTHHLVHPSGVSVRIAQGVAGSPAAA